MLSINVIFCSMYCDGCRLVTVTDYRKRMAESLQREGSDQLEQEETRNKTNLEKL